MATDAERSCEDLPETRFLSILLFSLCWLVVRKHKNSLYMDLPYYDMIEESLGEQEIINLSHFEIWYRYCNTPQKPFDFKYSSTVNRYIVVYIDNLIYSIY